LVTDGVADSIWIELPNITSSKGWPIYAAVRIIDNGAMLNVNTVYANPNPGAPDERKGDMLTDVYIDGLVKSGGDQISNFISNRDSNPINAETYYMDVSRRIDNPVFNPAQHVYTLYDISEELSLRNRFILYPEKTITRLEEGGLKQCLSTTLRAPGYGNSYTPYTNSDFDAWKRRFNPFDVGISSSEPQGNNYDFRHLLTTYNMDRIITPEGGKMLNVNTLTATNETLRIIRAALPDAGDIDVSATAAQITANLIDFRDENSAVTAVGDKVGGKTYYGFERPCVYISELAENFEPIPGDPNRGSYRSYAIELYKPYFEDDDPVGWRLVIDNPPRKIPVNWSGTRRFHVVLFNDPKADLKSLVGWSEPNSPNPLDGAMWVDPMVELAWPVKPRAASYDLYLGTDFEDVNGADKTSDEFIINRSDNNYPVTDYNASGLQPETTYYWRIDDVNGADTWKGDVWTFTTARPGSGYSSPEAQLGSDYGWSPGIPVFDGGSIIELQRRLVAGGYVVVDSVRVPAANTSGWLTDDATAHSYQRDITLHKCIRRLWDDSFSQVNSPTLGSANIYRNGDSIYIKAHPYLAPDVYGNDGFKNIGEIGMLFWRPAYYGIGEDPNLLGVIGYSNNADTEREVCIDLANPDFQQLFDYLTVFDPTSDGIDNNGNGRIDAADVNTPEWKVPGRININTAPWYVIAQLPWMTPEIAQAIAFYRNGPDGPFRSIGQLNNVPGMDFYAKDNVDQDGFPDLTPKDGVEDDLEERDLIFARISNLVTVRSDVFTAYILVRIGSNGPQKSVIAILDRSNVKPDGAGGVTGRVKVRALQPVPDPR